MPLCNLEGCEATDILALKPSLLGPGRESLAMARAQRVHRDAVPSSASPEMAQQVTIGRQRIGLLDHNLVKAEA
jgi:hypothetical protein